MPMSGYGNESDPAEVLANRLLEKHGSDPAQAKRSEHGWANEVWLGATAVARIKLAVHGAFEREVALAALLPPEVSYPEVLDLGVTEGMEWMVTKRLPGENLKLAWPSPRWVGEGGGGDRPLGQVGGSSPNRRCCCSGARLYILAVVCPGRR